MISRNEQEWTQWNLNQNRTDHNASNTENEDNYKYEDFSFLCK